MFKVYFLGYQGAALVYECKTLNEAIAYCKSNEGENGYEESYEVRQNGAIVYES